MLTRNVAILLALGGCSSTLVYDSQSNTAQLPANSLRFSLQDSIVTFSNPSTASPAPSSSGQAAAAPKQTDNCVDPKSTTKPPKSATNANWSACLNGAQANVTPTAEIQPRPITPPSRTQPPTLPQALTPVMHTAVPDDPQTLWLTTTTISGTPLSTPQDGLYNSVTVTYRSNTSAVIAGAGTAAAAGFAFGPAGGIIGGIVGGIAALPISPHIVPQQLHITPTITDYICPSDQGPAFPDLSNVASNPPPSLVLPVAIHAADARPYASQTDAKSETHTAAVCWHILPNGAHLHDATAAPTRGTAPSTPRKPINGDGWLYRVVADDPSQPPKDPNQPAATPVADYFASKTTRSDFPYSACRQVAIQITWWQALADSLQGLRKGDEPNTLSVSYGAVVADPAYVYKADVSKGATITFKPTCGANVSVSPDTSFSTNASAAVTAAEGIYKAEQTWATSKAK